MIDTQAIRRKILDLAMRGKLTEQLPEDGTAEELYRQIQAERKKQESTGIIKAVEVAPDMPETEMPFVIPANWKWTKLGNVSYIVRGGSPRPIKQYITNQENGINWIKIGDVEKGGKYISSTQEKIIPEGAAKSRRVYPGDFLLTNSMSFGRPYISQIEGCIHDGWLLIHDFSGFDPDFLYYLLSSSYLYGQFTVKASGSTVNNLNIDKVKEAIMPLPPLAEQHRIVARIEQAFSLLDTIDALQAKYADNLAVLKSKLIDAAIRGKLTDQLPEDGTAEELYRQIQAEKQALIKSGKIKKEKPLPEIAADEVPFGIPSNWKWVRVGSVAEVAGGTTPKSSEICAKGTIPYFKVSDMNAAGNETHMIHASNFISKGYTGRVFPVGTTIFPKNGGAALTNKRRVLVVPSAVDLNTGGCTPVLFEMTEWIRLFMDTIDFGKMDTGSNIPTVNATNLKNQYLPLPPLAEQKRIVAKLEEVLEMIGQTPPRALWEKNSSASQGVGMEKETQDYSPQGDAYEL